MTLQRIITNAIENNAVDSTKIADNAVGITQLSVSSDGNAGEFLQTNGAGVLSFSSGGIPVGVVVMWSGAIANIPTGWALCDGTNSTPDLRDRFVIGAGSSHAVDATGGSTDTGAHTLTVAEIPAHSHNITLRTSSSNNQAGGGASGNGPFAATPTSDTGGGQPHTHTGTLPPYFALAYIIKT